MVKKLQIMSNGGKVENEGLIPKQKEFIEFLEKASNQTFVAGSQGFPIRAVAT